MPDASETRQRQLRDLGWAFVRAAARRFTDIGIWPRPAASRLLRWGPDFGYEDLAQLKEFAALCDWLRADPALEAMYWKGGDNSTVAHIWFSLVIRTLAASSGAEPKRAVFSRQSRLLVSELYRTTARMRAVTLLTGLNLSVERLRLNHNTSIVRLPSLPELAQRLLDRQFGSYYMVIPGHDVHCALVTEANVKKDDFLLVASREVRRSTELNDFETALWLYSEGKVQRHTRYELQVARFPLVQPSSYDVGVGDGTIDWGEVPANITGRDGQKVVRLWRELTDVRVTGLGSATNDRLWVAISRFRESYEKMGWVDNLVDLAVALEALFGPKDARELTKRLQLRTAFLLGDGDGEAREIYKRVGILYDIRSRILHGSMPNRREYRKWLEALTGKKVASPYEWSNLLPGAVGVARELVRRSIVGCLRLSKCPQRGPTWPLPDEFDQEMATLGGKHTWREAFRRAERP